MLIKRLEADRLEASKRGDIPLRNLLSTMFAEAYMIGKDNGNRLPTDDETIKVIQKFRKNAETNHQLTGKDQFLREIEVADRYLPKMLNEEELRSIIISFGTSDIGEIMRRLKKEYPGQYDGKLASQIAKG